jgi:hypothetical protein
MGVKLVKKGLFNTEKILNFIELINGRINEDNSDDRYDIEREEFCVYFQIGSKSHRLSLHNSGWVKDRQKKDMKTYLDELKLLLSSDNPQCLLRLTDNILIYPLRIESYQKNQYMIIPPGQFYIYKNNLYHVSDMSPYSEKEIEILIKENYYKNNERFQRLIKEIELFEKLDSEIVENISREPIPESIRFIVWRRDEGKCVRCGSQNNLEFDHIIPVSKGGSNTERNVQLLCETCNREKSNRI